MDEAAWPDCRVGTPREWWIVFKRGTRYRWASWLAMGTYKHVACFGRVDIGWVFVNFGPNEMTVSAVRDGALVDKLMHELIDDALVLRWVPPLIVTEMRLKAVFCCTTLVAHLTGVRSSALRPDRFLRDCLAQGATVLQGDDEHQTATARSGT